MITRRKLLAGTAVAAAAANLDATERAYDVAVIGAGVCHVLAKQQAALDIGPCQNL